MSRQQDGEFHIGETWPISGIARDDLGNLLDLTGATVRFRLATTEPNAIVLDLVTPTNGSITNATGGAYSFLITPTMQVAANMDTTTGYCYEVSVVLNNGATATLNTGTITAIPSLFINFP